MSEFSADGLRNYREALEAALSPDTVPGAVMLVARGDDIRIDALGTADVVGDEPLAVDAIFRIQSMTKAVSAVATLQLIEQGKIALYTPVDTWLPELAHRSVLRTPGAGIDDVVPARRAITVEDLLTCRSGYGISEESPISREMESRGLAPGPTMIAEPSDRWLARFGDLPLMFQPGEGWRYHTSFEILGVFLARLVEKSLADLLAESVFVPLDMRDTSFFVPPEKRHRLPAAYQVNAAGELDEIEPAAGGFYAEEPPFQMDHGELVSTVRDYHRLALMLMQDGVLDGHRVLSSESVARMTADHIPPSQKTDDAFYPGFWNNQGWGYGISVSTAPDDYGAKGRYGWGGGLGTMWFNDPASRGIGIIMPQIAVGPEIGSVINAFHRAAAELVSS